MPRIVRNCNCTLRAAVHSAEKNVVFTYLLASDISVCCNGGS